MVTQFYFKQWRSLIAWLSRLAKLGVFLGLIFSYTVCFSQELKVLVVLSDNKPAQHDFLQHLKQKMPVSIQLRTLQHAEYFLRDPLGVDLIVSVGNRAADIVTAKSLLPVLATMLPKPKYEELRIAHPELYAMSAIYLDQPWDRQLDLIRAILPDKRKIGVLYSPDKHLDLDELKRSTGQPFELIVQPVKSMTALFDSLTQLLSESEVLLAIPDRQIYNGSSIRNILLSSYQRRVPLIGLSQHYVNAGALSAVFSTPEQYADQTMDIITAYADTRKLPIPQYPSRFTVAVNYEVARTLQISIQSVEAVQLKMRGGVQESVNVSQ